MLTSAWKLLSSRRVADHRIFLLNYDRYRLAGVEQEKDYVVLDAPDWINVIALTGDQQQVVLVRQYRHGVRQVTLELPGGMVDPGESPETAALRELREETGYAGQKAHSLGHVWPNPAMQNNRCHFFLVRDAQLAGDPQWDPYERMEVELRPMKEIPRLIADGTIRHALVVAAFAHHGIAAEL